MGNVVIGRREEGKKPGGTSGLDETALEAEEGEGLLARRRDGGADDVLVELDEAAAAATPDDSRRLRRAEEADAPI